MERGREIERGRENLETTLKDSFSFNCYIHRLSEEDLTCDSDGEQLRWSFKSGMFQNCCKPKFVL